MRLALAACGLLALCAYGCDDGDRAAGSPAAPPAPPTTTPYRPTGGALRYLALGDSYTKGEGVLPAERWPVRLAARLRAAGVDVADPEVIAETGWRTDDLAAAVAQARPTRPYHLVSLLIGVNNQFAGGRVEAYRMEFGKLLARAIALAGGDPSRVLVLSIPDWGATPFGRTQGQAPGPGTARFNAVARALCGTAGVRYVDVTPVSRDAATDPGLTLADDLHPSGKMYAAWVELALPEAKNALSGKPQRRTVNERPMPERRNPRPPSNSSFGLRH